MNENPESAQPATEPQADRSRVTRRHLIGTAGVAGLGVLLAACGGGNTSASDTAAADTGAPAPGGGEGGESAVYYWISHGSSADQIWVQANAGADAAGRDLGASVNVSFHNGDLASQKEAFSSAVAAGANGIATTSPQPGVLNQEITDALAAGIPVVMTNTDDPDSDRLAFVGANLEDIGVRWADYLVSNNLVKEGDFVWLPVEIAGATYQVAETTGIDSVFKPLGIQYEVFEAGTDPAKSLANMTDYLTANQDKVTAMIALGDLVAANAQKALEAVNFQPGDIAVVGWGNSLDAANAVKAGYINAAAYQYPDSQGYQPIVLLKMANDGFLLGYDISTQALYDKSNVDQYITVFQ